MDGHVQEHAAGAFDVFSRRGSRVSAGDAQDVQRTDLAGLNELTYLFEIGVEAAVESNLALDARFFDRCDGSVDLLQGMIDRFFTENVFASVGRFDHQGGMGGGGGANSHRINAFVCHDLGVIICRDRNVQFGCQLLRCRQVHIRDRDYFNSRNARGQVLRMDLANATCSDHTNTNHFLACHSISLFLLDL